MQDNNDTIDYDSRAEICNKVNKVLGQMEIIYSLLYYCSDLGAENIDDMFEVIEIELETIRSLAWGNKNPHALFASPSAAFEVYKKISEHQLGQERDKYRYFKGADDGQ